MKSFTLWIEDFDVMGEDGVTPEQQDSLVLALWHWHRGINPDKSKLEPIVRVLYSQIIKKIIGSETKRTAGKKGAMTTNGRKKINSDCAFPQASTIPSTNQAARPSAEVSTHPSAEVSAHPSASGSSTATSTSTPNSTATPSSTATSSTSIIKTPTSECECMRRHFVPPTLSEIKNFCETEGISIDPEKFLAYYESVGWKVGKKPMKDWKASVRYWGKNDHVPGPRRPMQTITHRNDSTFKQANYQLQD